MPEISSRAGAPRPEIVKAVHADYIAAGARVITLNTCSASPKRLARNGPDPAAYVDFALGRVDMGATIIGGCCKTTLAHIAEPARTLLRADHTII